MSKRKGVSADEKRQRLMGIYHDTKQVYNLKEIEKLGAKKGIVLQTIKDVNQSLIDDDLVCTEKIGSGNYYWSFPSKAQHALQTRHASVVEDLEVINKKLRPLQDDIDRLKADRVQSDEREESLRTLVQTREEIRKHRAFLEAQKENDPEVLRALEGRLQTLKEGADRWTDNVWNLKTWLISKNNMDCTKVDEWLGLSDEFDYVE